MDVLSHEEVFEQQPAMDDLRRRQLELLQETVNLRAAMESCLPAVNLNDNNLHFDFFVTMVEACDADSLCSQQRHFSSTEDVKKSLVACLEVNLRMKHLVSFLESPDGDELTIELGDICELLAHKLIVTILKRSPRNGSELLPLVGSLARDEVNLSFAIGGSEWSGGFGRVQNVLVRKWLISNNDNDLLAFVGERKHEHVKVCRVKNSGVDGAGVQADNEVGMRFLTST